MINFLPPHVTGVDPQGQESRFLKKAEGGAKMKNPAICGGRTGLRSTRRALQRPDNRGFTLVELIVSIVILAIVFIPLLHTFVTSAQTELKSRLKNDATMLAQSTIEDIQATDMETLLSGCTETQDEFGKGTGIYTKQSTSAPFDVAVTLSPVHSVNDKRVAVSNAMDAVIDMSSADEDALNEFYSECNGQADTATLQNALTRKIEINSKLQKDGTYQVSVVFHYGGTVSYRVTSEDNTATFHTVTLNYTASDKAVVTAPTDAAAQTLKRNGGAAYSLYLYFSPILHASSKSYYPDTVEITNGTAAGVSPNGLDFNVFLIDTVAHENNVNYVPQITYGGQNDLTRARVFSNVHMTDATDFLRGYLACKNVEMTGKKATISIDGTLVEKQAQNRMYNVEVAVSRAGTALVDMSAVKLG